MLNEDLVFALKGAGNTSAYRTAFENRRNWYGQGLMLLNSTSHDEQNFSDPWQALIRFGVASTIDGAPMIFQGQELGLSDFFGFDLMEKNLCKYVPHFKTWNSMMPLWADADYGNDQLYPVYSGINKAREASPALRSSNRWFLNQTSGSTQESIFSVAKYETAGAPPNVSDVVLAFMNLDRNNPQSGTFNLNINSGGSNLFGIKSGRTYNIKNLAAYTGANPNRRSEWVWTTSRTGADLLANGIGVILNKVPTTVADWTNAPFEAQYLKVYDVTPPPAMTAPTSPKPYVIGTNALFSWTAASDPEGGISGYRLLVGTSPGGSNVFNGILTGTSQTVSAALGQTLYATVIALNNAGIAGPASPSSTGVLLLDAAVDNDGDGMTNGSEHFAGTNPLDANSVLRILNLGGGGALLTWSSESGKSYQVYATTNLSQPFAPLSDVLPSGGAQTMFTNPAPDAGALLYRVAVLP